MRVIFLILMLIASIFGSDKENTVKVNLSISDLNYAFLSKEENENILKNLEITRVEAEYVKTRKSFRIFRHETTHGPVLNIPEFGPGIDELTDIYTKDISYTIKNDLNGNSFISFELPLKHNVNGADLADFNISIHVKNFFEQKTIKKLLEYRKDKDSYLLSEKTIYASFSYKKEPLKTSYIHTHPISNLSINDMYISFKLENESNQRYFSLYNIMEHGGEIMDWKYLGSEFKRIPSNKLKGLFDCKNENVEIMKRTLSSIYKRINLKCEDSDGFYVEDSWTIFDNKLVSRDISMQKYFKEFASLDYGLIQYKDKNKFIDRVDKFSIYNYPLNNQATDYYKDVMQEMKDLATKLRSLSPDEVEEREEQIEKIFENYSR